MSTLEINSSIATDSHGFTLPRGKIIDKPDFSSQNETLSVEADEMLETLSLPEYIIKSNGYRALNVFEKKGLIKKFNIDVVKSGQETIVKLQVTSNDNQEYSHYMGGTSEDLEQASSTFDNMVGDLVITEMLGLEGGYLPVDRKIMGSREYVIYDKKDPSMYIAKLHIPVYPGSTANKAALAEILKPDSQIISYLQKR